ncbi:MAG: DUF4276 family protein [Pseudonocardia sp.]|nr:DUF4276 family protein [Pseudonocardia sp.]
MPLADVVETLFLDRGTPVVLSRPDFGILSDKIGKDIGSRLTAGRSLLREQIDLVVVHRDADNAGWDARVAEIHKAVVETAICNQVVPIVPVRMTEAWLLLDEAAIRTVAGNPQGTSPLALPGRHEVERVADPKQTLREALSRAANVTGRRRERLVRRFSENRRQLLERLDTRGPVAQLASWRALDSAVGSVVESWNELDQV